MGPLRPTVETRLRGTTTTLSGLDQFDPRLDSFLPALAHRHLNNGLRRENYCENYTLFLSRDKLPDVDIVLAQLIPGTQTI